MVRADDAGGDRPAAGRRAVQPGGLVLRHPQRRHPEPGRRLRRGHRCRSCSTGGRVLVDPNTFSADGTSSLTSLHREPRRRRWPRTGVSDGGSDWADLPLLDLATGEPVDERRSRPSSPRPSGCRTAGRTSTSISSIRATPRAPRRRRCRARAAAAPDRRRAGRRRADLGVPRERPADLLAGGHRRRPLRRGHASSRAPRTATGCGSTRSSTESEARAGSGSRSRSSTSRWRSSCWSRIDGVDAVPADRPGRRTRPGGRAWISTHCPSGPARPSWHEVLAESEDTLMDAAGRRGRIRGRRYLVDAQPR